LDHGNRMSPTHANKLGVRYRYYVSQAILQNRKVEAGSIARVRSDVCSFCLADRHGWSPIQFAKD
jgi:hypothetical protein